MNSTQQLLEMPSVGEHEEFDVGFYSIKQMLEIEGLEDDLMMYEMGLNFQSSSDSDNEDEDGSPAAAVQNNNNNNNNIDSQQTHEEQHEEDEQATTQGNSTEKRELSLDTKRKLVDELLTFEHNGKLAWGTKKNGNQIWY